MDAEILIIRQTGFGLVAHSGFKTRCRELRLISAAGGGGGGRGGRASRFSCTEAVCDSILAPPAPIRTSWWRLRPHLRQNSESSM